MKSTDPQPAAAREDAYRIAAVSRLTGMPIPTIRMWERRYGVVAPARSTGNGRLYSRSDIDRLVLLKAAVDAGHAIGTIASLSDDQIRARLGGAMHRLPPQARSSCRIGVEGAALLDRLRQAWSARTDIQLSAASASPDSPGEEGLDALIVEIATLAPPALKALRQLRSAVRPGLTVVVYGFGTRQALARLDEEGVLAVGMPADPAHLARICLLGVAYAESPRGGIEQMLLQPAGPRRYDAQFLAAIARRPGAMRCECPSHLSDLLVKLNAFEQYSLECESAELADASVHALLYSAAAHCREVLEHALERVLAHEGVQPPPAPLRQGGADPA
ncbi:hypothetical protein C3942_11655 [Solimonas fluminis]|uniref:HTH merR-type domain-containing protein n=1 Tax=Solimonas fluminis TaxID=2086571 RepID=A0A2S5TGG8_9GAMM|nr:MerR family transcriptional regulator [Solimonas fluminis]PPE74037.1 hypothetical protein C3942_11655 [Solimonas fluminis]